MAGWRHANVRNQHHLQEGVGDMTSGSDRPPPSTSDERAVEELRDQVEILGASADVALTGCPDTLGESSGQFRPADDLRDVHERRIRPEEHARDHTEILRSADAAATRSLAIILDLSRRFGSAHQVEDADGLRGDYRRLREHLDALGAPGTPPDATGSPAADAVGPARRSSGPDCGLVSLVSPLGQFHRKTESLYFSLEHRLAMLAAEAGGVTPANDAPNT